MTKSKELLRRLRGPRLFAIVWALSTALTSIGEAQSALHQRGEVIARGMCSGCHAVGKTGDSPHPAAPRFRSLENQTDLDKLAQRMREGIVTGHEDMPMFRFKGGSDADAVVAYIRSIQRP